MGGIVGSLAVRLACQERFKTADLIRHEHFPSICRLVFASCIISKGMTSVHVEELHGVVHHHMPREGMEVSAHLLHCQFNRRSVIHV